LFEGAMLQIAWVPGPERIMRALATKSLRARLNPVAASRGSVWLKKRLSLVTFFAAAKKVTPPPGRRLLHKQHDNSSAFRK
jgi:hypothetical protein